MSTQPEHATGRIPGEGARPYAAFRIYAEMGPERTHAAVAKKFRRNINMIHRWATAHNWAERIVTWEGEQKAREDAAKAQAELELQREKAKRRDQVQESAWAMFVSLRDKARAMLNFPVSTKDDMDVKRDKKGRVIAKTTVIAPKFRYTDLAKIVEVADALGRLACEMPSKVMGLSDPEGKPFTMPPQSAPAPVTMVVNVMRDEQSDREVELYDSAGEREPARRA